MGYAVFTAYMTVRNPRSSLTQESELAYGEAIQFAAIYLAIKGVQEVSDEKKSGTSFSGLFSNTIFRDIVISLAATIGLYVISSVVHVRGLSFEVRELALNFLPP